MDKKEQIRQSLQDMAQRFGPLNTMLAQVVSVDEDALTCELIADELEVYDVRLSPVLTGNQSVVLFPKINSWVLCARIENDEDWMIISSEQIDKFRITSGNQVFEMDGEKFLVKNEVATLKDALILFVEAMEPIVIMEGRNPDLIKLAQAKEKLLNLLS